MSKKNRLWPGVLSLAVVFFLAGLAYGDIYQQGETCLACHVWNKSGHQEQKKDCGRCHDPGEKKEIHNLTVFAGGDVTDPSVWEAWCGYCHEWNKSGHIRQKKECRKCHGSGAKKDVHIQMKDVDVQGDCSACHGVHGDLIVPNGCWRCHQYAEVTDPWHEWCAACHSIPDTGPPEHLRD